MGNPEYEWGRPSYPITSPGKKDVRSPKRGEPGGGCLEAIAVPALALTALGVLMAKPKKSKDKADSGPYTWGNGPQPYGLIKRLIKKIQGK